MKRFAYLFILLLILSSCHQKQKLGNSQFDREFYNVLNSLIQFRFTNIAVVLNETMPVYRNIYGNSNDSMKFEDPQPPPPPGIISYDKNSFDAYIVRKYMDSIDAAFMYNTIDSTYILKIDSSQVIIPVITSKQMHDVFDNSDPYEGYNKLTKRYGKNCFIVVSTPIFNSDFTKVIISIDRSCGPLSGQGHEFILEKRNGKWRLVLDGGTWKS